MENIEELLRLRKELLEEFDKQIVAGHTRTVTLLFTDIVGSTSFFERMGDIAGRQMLQTHNDLLFPIIASFGGKVVKTIGDSIMAYFDDSGKAVRCCVEMQKAIHAYNAGVSAALGFSVRMGLHSGRAVVEERDLFGDVVNTAARVESRAEGSEIVVSGAVKESAEGIEEPFVSLGTETVKGKDEKIDFFIVNWEGRKEEEILEIWRARAAQKRPAAEAAAQSRAGERAGPREAAGPITPAPVPAAGAFIKGRIDPRKELDLIPPLPKKGNPFLNRVMIPRADMFFGRRPLVKKIMSRVSNERPQSVSIVGERRIGKSSLLNFLRSPRARLDFLPEPDSRLFLYIDFQQARNLEPGQFFGLIFSEMKKRFSAILDLELPTSEDGMRSLCEAISGGGLTLVLLFDEFECVTKNPRIGPEFYSFLRSLANNFPLCFITATGRGLKDMCVSHAISDSPFFNIFSVHHVGPFQEEEAAELIRVPSGARGIPLAPLMGKIVEMGGLYPFFLQMACSAWFEYLEAEAGNVERFTDAPTPREVTDSFREEAQPHFEFILESASPEEQDAFGAVTAEGSMDGSDRVGMELERKGYLRRESGMLVPFSAEFGRFLASARRS
jgi:class 3 adenylate cyclase